MKVLANKTVKVTGEWLFFLNNKLVRQEKNLLVQCGLNFLAKLLIREDDQTNDIPFHLALGTGTTAAAAGNTKLEVEKLRKVVSAKTRQVNLVRLRTYFLASEANQDWQEFGIFLAGTDEKDTGTLLNRLVSPVSKTSQQALTIEVRITFEAG